MGSVIECFMLAPLPRVTRSLRRYAGIVEGATLCTGRYGYHNAETPLGELELAVPPDGTYERATEDDEVAHDDPRWPTRCECGYEFAADDHRQVREERLYSPTNGGPATTLDDAPPGAMWFAWWFSESCRGPDGKTLVLKTPGGDWIIDHVASNGPGWTRTGTPPKVTARPSIGIGGKPGEGWKYHGFLTDGRLEEC
jgi:hypothetical protein